MSEFLSFPRRKLPNLIKEIEDKFGFESEIHFYLNSDYIRYATPVKVLKYNKQEYLHIKFETAIDITTNDILIKMQKNDVLKIYQKQIFKNGDIHYIHLQTRNK